MLSENWRMNGRASQRRVLWLALFLGVMALLGFIWGHGPGQNYPGADSGSQTAVSSSETATPASSRTPAAVSVVVSPDNLRKLNGKEFVDALPSLEKLARNGNLDAVHLLYDRLASCADYQKKSDEEIRTSENDNYQHQIEVTRKIRAEHPNISLPSSANEDALKHTYEEALKRAFDERDLCTALTPLQIESRLDWVQFALERHDRTAILDAAALRNIGVRGIERIRNAERMVQMAEIEKTDLDDLIATGDVTALERAAYAYGSDLPGILSRDPELAYTYAYALSLLDGNEMQQQMNAQMVQSIASGQGFYPPLTEQQIANARAAGLALFQQCYRNSAL